MSDIFSTFLSSESSLKRNKYSNNYSAKSNKIFLDNGLRLSKEGNVLRLPRLKFNSRIITDNNKNNTLENINLNNNNEIIIINNTEEDNNKIFKNEHLSDLSRDNNERGKSNGKYNKIKVKLFNKQLIKNRNKLSKSNYNKHKFKNLTFEEINIINERKKRKEKFINDYIESLLNKGKEKHDKFSAATKKIESNKYSLANSINPKKYIQKKILDDTFDYNEFRTSKIQKDCFNGNEKFRKANYKNIKINLMNNIFLNAMKAQPEESETKFLIDKMIAEQNHLNNLRFGKNVFNQKNENI